MKVTSVLMTCSASPIQWEGECEGRPVYVRFRRGRLTVSVGDRGGDIDSAVDGVRIVETDDFDESHVEWWEVEAILDPIDLEAAIANADGGES